MRELSEPVEVCLKRLDMIYVHQYAQASGSPVAKVIRELVNEAIIARDRKHRPDATVRRSTGLHTKMESGGTTYTPEPEFKTGPQGAKAKASTKVGKKGPTMDTIPQTRAERDRRAKLPKYEITHVGPTETEEVEL